MQITFAIGLSGSVSCIIHGADLLSYEGRSRRPFVFGDSEGRTQNYAEGAIIATLTLVCAASAFFVFYFSKLPVFMCRDVLILAAMSVFVVATVNIFQAYAIETSYYRMNRLLPFSLWEWFETPVKRGSGVAKRLVRIVSFALTECKSPLEFYNKVDSLLLSYIRRTYFSSQ